MKNANQYKPYKKSYDYSYTFGAFPTIELLKKRMDLAAAVVIRSNCRNPSDVTGLCKGRVPLLWDDKIFQRLGAGENATVMGIFRKCPQALSPELPHIVLFRPEDMGNLGTVMRTALAFGYGDLAVVSPAADVFHPKTVRASMGAIFELRIGLFSSFESYAGQYPRHERFLFMPGAKVLLTSDTCPQTRLFSLVFGGEGPGLEAGVERFGTAVGLCQTDKVDSLNLSVAAALGAYIFAGKNGLV